MATDGDRIAYEDTEVERIHATERERLRALVAADAEVANRLHADDFQLINPGEGVVSKQQYLGRRYYWNGNPVEAPPSGSAAAVEGRCGSAGDEICQSMIHLSDESTVRQM